MVESGGGGEAGGSAGSYGTGATEASDVDTAGEEVDWTDSLAGLRLVPSVECDAVPLVVGVAPVAARGSSVGMLTVSPGQPDGPSA